jgi:hypothetical protein
MLFSLVNSERRYVDQHMQWLIPSISYTESWFRQWSDASWESGIVEASFVLGSHVR